jgi:hypothetical protein
MNVRQKGRLSVANLFCIAMDLLNNHLYRRERPTACVTRMCPGVDFAWEQEKLEASKTLENAAESPASSARCVGYVLP